MMLEVVPQYLQALDPREDRTRLMFARLGLSEEELGREQPGGIVVVSVPAQPRPAQALLVRQLVDLLARLQPLVGRVVIDAPDPRAAVGDLEGRFPIRVDDVPMPSGLADVAVRIGGPASSGTYDVAVDAAGWAVRFGGTCSADDQGNPFGALAGAALAAGDVFKLLAAKRWPGISLARQMALNEGSFSLWNYSQSETSPRLAAVHLQAILVGCGGVGSGVVVALGSLGSRVSGELQIVDHDALDLYNLNRVTFARVEDARREEGKVEAAERYLGGRAPALTVLPVRTKYREFKRRIPRREDRTYELILTGVDSDDARIEVQADLPRFLVDGSTGASFNCTVESVDFGVGGCLACSRPAVPPPPPNLHCDDAPVPKAPSISFLSAFAGTLVAAEGVKLALGYKSESFGRFEHVFVYGLNPDLRGRVGLSSRCLVRCSEENVRSAFARKWGPVG